MVEAVVVVEASQRSGALMTAHAAIDLGREAMAVPGSPLEPRARGANALIKEGAMLVESGADVVACLGAACLGAAPVRQPQSAPREEHQASVSADLVERVAQALSPTPLHVNVIARALDAPAAAVAAALTELELMGQAVSEPGGYASRLSRTAPS